MRYLGCSCGYLIFSNLEQYLLVDVYSGAIMRPPKLKSSANRDVYYGALIAPINLSNSHLLFCSRSSMFQWTVGSNFWSEHPLAVECIIQIVFFKGEIFAIDCLQRLHRIHLGPQLSMLEVGVVWDEGMFVGLRHAPWLVVCGDMLLLVDFSLSINSFSELSGTFNVFCIDFQVEPAKWIKVDDLGDNALFVSIDRRNPTFSCMSPEKWGGKRNCIYVASQSADSNEAWSAFEVGQVVLGTELCSAYSSNEFRETRSCVHWRQLQSLWELPSFVYGVRR